MPAAIFTSTIETGNPQSHPNFKLFKNDHCGIVSTNRISFGIIFSLYVIVPLILVLLSFSVTHFLYGS